MKVMTRSFFFFFTALKVQSLFQCTDQAETALSFKSVLIPSMATRKTHDSKRKAVKAACAQIQSVPFSIIQPAPRVDNIRHTPPLASKNQWVNFQ
jgi:hypothetical protein